MATSATIQVANLQHKQNRYAAGKNLAVLFCPAPNGKVFGVTIDRADLHRVLAAGHWCVHNFHSGRKNSQHFALYAFRNKKGGGAELLHRFLLNNPKGKLVDHRNRRTLDNRRSCSIRIATRSQNAINGRTRRDSTTGYRGVTPNPSNGTFRARIWIDGKRTTLGFFPNAVDAAKAYDAAALEHHGEFAFLNFPEQGASYAERGGSHV